MVWQQAAMRTALSVSPRRFAHSAEARTTAAAPSFGAHTSSRWIGSHTIGEARICSMVNALRYIACGLWTLFLWFWYATLAICVSVVPYSCMWRRARIDQYEGLSDMPSSICHWL